MTTRLKKKKKPVNKLSLIVSAVRKLKETKSNKHSSKSETYINKEIIVKLNIKKKNTKGDQRKCSSICKILVINIKNQ